MCAFLFDIQYFMLVLGVRIVVRHLRDFQSDLPD